MVILDTNIIIDHLRQPPDRSLIFKLLRTSPRSSIALSVISLQELYEGKSMRDEANEHRVIDTIALFTVLSYTHEIAKMAGSLARELPRSIETADAAIAATAIVHGAQLFTLNKKDFLGIPSLDFYQLAE